METANDDQTKFDLEERTARFGEAVIRFARTLRSDMVTRPLASQLVRAVTSVGANYLEADDAGSRREFHYRISLSRREARETKHWLRMVVAVVPECREAALPLWQEARELHLIFAAINRRKSQE